MEIRHLSPADAALHCEVSARYKECEITREYSERFLADDRNILIVAVSDNEVIGFVLAYEMMRVDIDLPMMMLYEIETREDYQRQGVGRAMIEELKRICRERKTLKMFVGTGTDNEAAIALYSSIGGIRMEGTGVGFDYNEF